MGLFDELDSVTSSNQEEQTRNKYARAPFGYIGNKHESMPQIIPVLTRLKKRKYISVFGGSGVDLINMPPSFLEVFNDRYAGVTAFYRCLRDYDKMQQMIQWLEKTCHSREEFVWCQSTWETCEDDIERASRWYYMMQSSFIKKGVAYARSTNSKAPVSLPSNLKEFNRVHVRFQNVQVENLDYKLCIKDYDGEDALFYCDPPYLGTDQGAYKCKFTIRDHHNFLDLIQSSKGTFAVSHYPNPLYDGFKWDEIIEWKVSVTATANAYTDNNYLIDNGSNEKTTAIERLYIKY